LVELSAELPQLEAELPVELLGLWLVLWLVLWLLLQLLLLMLLLIFSGQPCLVVNLLPWCGKLSNSCRRLIGSSFLILVF
jgi:hypothetical protein